MRFSIAAVLALASSAFAVEAVTETVTMYTTYCPEATSIVHGGTTYSISTPGHITLTGGHYTTSRPLLSSTVTECKKCSSSTPLVVSPSSSVPHLTSTPYIPHTTAATAAGSSETGSGSGETGVGAVGTASSPAAAVTSTQAAYNAGSTNVVGAGAGLAAVFGVAALLL
ncbi:hypothetical protein N7493_002186 [Penicillium malachiteum]|uniref:Clock-controlled protein 6 n=1 Tax=Penicillium malachiteum TaxID=1324776 RepID=A0AAD6HRQ9_9EURO|nr:hypothetical protein N7493_002186 [Penicillium malachiteum]